jgi:hypothetical protein
MASHSDSRVFFLDHTPWRPEAVVSNSKDRHDDSSDD